jgi:5-methyltetrahydropteroyltriglutamate--homocysteine methyltransferase
MPETIRIDHVGSLLRPSEVLKAREAYASGSIDLEALRAVEDKAILDVLAMQHNVGIPIFSDGEIRRDAWMSGLADAVEGFTGGHRMMHWTNLDGTTEDEPSLSKVAGSKLHQVRRLTGHEAVFLKEHAPGPFKITMPSPVSIAASGYREGITDAVYPDRGEFLRDLLDIVKGEMQELVKDGASYIQLDEGFTGYVGDRSVYPIERGGVPIEEVLAADIEAENSLYDALPRDGVTLAMHVCRGNSRSRWVGSGSYDGMAEQVFSTLHVDRFLLEFDSDRSGGFEPLKYVPKGKTVVLGLVTTKHGKLEGQDDLRRRLDEASKYLPLEQLALSPQCGFASVADGNLLSEDDQRRKLELVVDTARKIWG